MNSGRQTLVSLSHTRFPVIWLFVSAVIPALASAQHLDIAFDPSSAVAAELGVQDSLFSSSNPLATDSVGNVYISLESGPSIVRVTPTGETSLVFSAPDFLEDYAAANPDAALPLIDSIPDFLVDDQGTVYLAALPAQNILAAYPNGTVEILIDGLNEGDGEFLPDQKILALNPSGELYLFGLTSNRIYQITGDEPPSLLVDLDPVFDARYAALRSMVFAPDGTAILGSNKGIYSLKFNETANLVVQKLGNNVFEDYPYAERHEIAVDVLGNLYYLGYCYNPDCHLVSISGELGLGGGGAQLLATEAGDGTGYGRCVDFHYGQYVCNWYGNYFSHVESMFIDSAQNLFFVTGFKTQYPYKRGYRLWKLSPDGVLQVVIPDLRDLGGDFADSVEYFVFSTLGALYLADSFQNLILRIAPLPMGNADEFQLDTPHSQLSHSEEGIEVIPTGYTLVQQARNSQLNGQAAHLDTRNPTFAQIDWAAASLVISPTDYAGEPAERIRETHIEAGLTYTRETVVSTRSPDSLRQVRSVDYFLDSEIVLAARELRLPESFLRSFSNQESIRWLLNGNDIIEGGNRNDVLRGYAGHDVLYGWDGDDVFVDGPGADIFYGGDGNDKVVYELPREYYQLSRDPDDGSTNVKVKVGQGDPYVDWLGSDVEEVEFADAVVATAELSYFGEARALSTDAIELPDAESAVHRFFNARTQAFFYTPSLAERDRVSRNSGPDNEEGVNWPYVYQGAKFRAAHSYAGGSPLYRFYNTQTGHHFFTVNEDERAQILDKIASGEWSFIDEGVAFPVYARDPNPAFEGKETPVYRFFNPTLGRHAFTASQTEAGKFRVSPDWQDEGIGFWAESL